MRRKLPTPGHLHDVARARSNVVGRPSLDEGDGGPYHGDSSGVQVSAAGWGIVGYRDELRARRLLGVIRDFRSERARGDGLTSHFCFKRKKFESKEKRGDGGGVADPSLAALRW